MHNNSLSFLNKKTLLLFIKIFIALVALFILFHQVDMAKMEKLINKIPLSLLLICITIELFRILLVSIRWKSLSYASPQFSIFDYFRLSLIGITGNLIMPGSLGGDGVRVALVLEKVKEKTAHAIAIVFDRIIGLFSITLLAVFSLIFFETQGGENIYLIVSISSVLVFTLLIFIVISDVPYIILGHFFKKWNSLYSFFNKLKAGVSFYKNQPAIIIKAVILSFFIHIISIIICYILSQRLEINCTFTTFMIIIPLVWIITAIPLSLGGIGVREWSFVGLLSYQGVEAEKAVTLSLVLFLLTIITGLSGIPFIFNTKKSNIDY